MENQKSPGEVEWLDAQNINTRIDLIEAVKIQLTFLSEVDRNPCLYSSSQVITAANRRYTTYWLPLAAEVKDLVPPLDCAWIWHCHRLSPLRYERDCRTRFGKTVDATLLSGEAYEKGRRRAEELWRYRYEAEPYTLDLKTLAKISRPKICFRNNGCLWHNRKATSHMTWSVPLAAKALSISRFRLRI